MSAGWWDTKENESPDWWLTKEAESPDWWRRENASVDGPNPALAQLIDESVSFWRMQDNAASTVVVDSGQSAKNGALTGAGNTSASSIVGPTDNFPFGLSFDGSDDYVGSIGTSADYVFIQNALQFTIAFWVKFNSPTTRQYFLGNNVASTSQKGFAVAIENGAGAGTKAIRCLITKGTVSVPVIDFRTADNAINDAAWHHVAISCSSAGNSAAIHLDGVSVPVTYIGSYTALSTGSAARGLALGRCNDLTSLELAGGLSGVGIWNRVLTTEEIAVLAS